MGRIFLHVDDGAQVHVFDAGEFEETKHPRDPKGQFSKTAGAPQMNTNLANALKEHGYEKVKAKPQPGGAFATYTKPSGAKVTVHYPVPGSKGATNAATFTSEIPGKTAKTGKGIELSKLLKELNAREAEELKGFEAAQEVGPGIAAKETTTKYVSSTGVIYQLLTSKGYEASNAEGGGVVYKKAGATIVVNNEGKWKSEALGHLPKTGETPEGLELLLSGKPPPKDPPWKNSSATTPASGAAISEYKAPLPLYETPHGKLYEALKKSAPIPTPLQRQAVSGYTGSGYHEMNDCARHQEDCEDARVKRLESWLSEASIPEDVTLYRGLRADFTKFMKSVATVGMEFVDRGFLSMSTDEAFVDSWRHKGSSLEGLKMRIKVPKGSKGAPVTHIGGSSPQEMEVLFQRHSKMRVTGIDRANNTFDVELLPS